MQRVASSATPRSALPKKAHAMTTPAAANAQATPPRTPNSIARRAIGRRKNMVMAVLESSTANRTRPMTRKSASAIATVAARCHGRTREAPPEAFAR